MILKGSAALKRARILTAQERIYAHERPIKEKDEAACSALLMRLYLENVKGNQ